MFRTMNESLIDLLKYRTMGNHEDKLPFNYSRGVHQYTVVGNVVYTVELFRRVYKTGGRVEVGKEICVYVIEQVDLKEPDSLGNTIKVKRWTYVRLTEYNFRNNDWNKYLDCPEKYFDQVPEVVSKRWRIACLQHQKRSKPGESTPLGDAWLRTLNSNKDMPRETPKEDKQFSSIRPVFKPKDTVYTEMDCNSHTSDDFEFDYHDARRTQQPPLSDIYDII